MKILCVILMVFGIFTSSVTERPTHDTNYSLHRLEIVNTQEIEQIINYFLAGDAKGVSNYFASTLNFSLQHYERVYSKVQAERILLDFFQHYSPKEVQVVHVLESNPNFRYVVFSLVTQNQQFRVSFKLIAENNSFRLSELRIE